MPRSRFNATNDRDTRLSSPWNAKSFKKVVQTQYGNECFCYVFFFLVCWIMASASYILAEHRWKDTSLMPLIFVFFGCQVWGALCFGVFLDFHGRFRSLYYGIVTLCLGLLLVFVSCTSASIIHFSSFSSSYAPVLRSPPHFLLRIEARNTTQTSEASSPAVLFTRIPGPGLRVDSTERIFLSTNANDSVSTYPTTQVPFFDPPLTTTPSSTTTLSPYLLPASPWFFWTLAAGICILGAAVGGAYPICCVVAAESVDAACRLKHLGGLFCMQCLAHVALRLLLALLFHRFPTTTPPIAVTVLIAIAFFSSLSLCFSLNRFAKETKPYQKCYVQKSCAPAPWSLSRRSSLYFAEETNNHFFREGNKAMPGDHHHESNAVQMSNACDHQESQEEKLKESLLSSTEDSLVPEAHEFFVPPSFHKYCKTVSTYWSHARMPFWGSSVPWFLLDLSVYGDGIFHSLLIYHVRGYESEPAQNSFALLVAFALAFGAFATVLCLNRIIPKLFQILGFIVMAFVYFGLALSLFSLTDTPDMISEYFGASLLYDCLFRFSTLIPSVTCFIIPVDAFSTRVRGTFYGAAVAVSRLGALVGIFIAWKLITSLRYNRATMLSMHSLTALMAAAVTRALTPHIQPQQEDLIKLDLSYLLQVKARATTYHS